MTLDQITTFLTVHQLGSYSKAAERMYLPQPTVSNRIKQLETVLGKRLLLRGKSGVRLTEEGKAFLPYAQNVADALSKGKQAVEHLAQGTNGCLTIGCSNSFGVSALPSIIESFIQHYPDVAIKIYSHSTPEQIRLIKSKAFQLGITQYASNEPGLSFHLIYSEPVHAIVSSNHPFAAHRSIDLTHMAKERLILYQADTLYRKTIDLTFSQLNLNYNFQYETNNLPLINHLIQCNLGVFLSSKLFFRREIAEGILVPVPIEHNPLPPHQIFLMYAEDELNSLDYLFVRHIEKVMNVSDLRTFSI